ncbi:aminotransferase class IV [Treponema endosymbiont of Eucomonympha sp.]|uniref:aminotransferase class IV n=1 Tax=Treponema endosymbiont of Eucomonympha sp. TaxID=1580831 RepID=UPI000750742D|nr:aminotransferase class IV [Treponema endosymbiont of Eucomonympha sp.]
MDALGYYNGAWGPLDDMTVPMNDRGNYFGDGVYDSALTANRVIFTLGEHVDRFFKSAELLEIAPSCTKDELKALLNDLVRKVDNAPLLSYWQWTRGTGRRAHSFPGGKPNLTIMLAPVPPPDVYRKIRLITRPDTRFLHCNIKTLNLLPNVIAAQRAKEQGAHEAVLHRSGVVTECAHSNVHILKGGAFVTHPADNLILAGVARARLLAACTRLGVPAEERAFTLDELYGADEILVSSTSTFGRSAESVDGKPAGGKAPELLRKLQDAVFGEFLSETGWKPAA